MRLRSAVRLTLVTVLVLLAGAMCVHYEAVEDSHSPYPTIDQLHSDYSRYVGGTHYFWGVVSETTRDSFTTSYYDMEFVVSSTRSVERGDVVQVYGTLRPNQRIDAERIVVSDPTGRSYMFAVSILAALLTFTTVARHWTLDGRLLSLTPRQAEDDPDA